MTLQELVQDPHQDPRNLLFLHQLIKLLMALSDQTILNLADALLPEVVGYIFEDQRWCDFLHEIIPDAVQDKLGDIDEDLKFELSMCIMDKIILKSAT